LIRVYILTESAITRAGLEALLAAHSEIEIAASEDEADVLLTETMDGLSTELPTVLLNDDTPTRVMLRSGVRAVLPREAPPAQIAAAIQAAAAGLVAIPAAEALPLLPLAPEDGQLDRLTPREIEVLEMLAEGVSNKVIAYRLSISEHTAKYHVNSILAKLNAGTRTEAVMRGVRLGLVKL
jgi:DNA-binding NarL/FixJ family response regulator